MLPTHIVGCCAALALGSGGAPALGGGRVPAQITVDARDVETVAKFAKRAQAVARTWYPRIAAILGVSSVPSERVTIRISLEAGGVAGTSGRRIEVSARYVARNPNDLGMIVHELAHVVQAYPKYDPAWLVEGIADYVRFYHFEPASARPHPDPARANCRDSYRTTACFLDWACRTYDRDLVRKLDAALKASTYSEEMWKALTGKDLDALNAEWLESLRKG